jgi:plasmid maintenance system antidote protein VapI
METTKMRARIETAQDLRVLIARYDIKQRDFAAMTGIPSQRLNDLLHGRQPLTASTRVRIDEVARALELDPPTPVEAASRPSRETIQVRLSQL